LHNHDEARDDVHHGHSAERKESGRTIVVRGIRIVIFEAIVIWEAVVDIEAACKGCEPSKQEQLEEFEQSMNNVFHFKSDIVEHLGSPDPPSNQYPSV
jgi:hypothetical protein